MVRRFACFVFLLFGVVSVLGALPSAAQTPNPNSNYQGCQAFLSDVTVLPGQPVTISGSGANPGDTVTALIDAKVGTGVADENGNFSFPGTIPPGAGSGPHVLTVRCGPNGGAAEINLTVGSSPAGSVPRPRPGNAPGSAGNAPLAKTGAGYAIPLTKVGIVLVAFGGLILAGTRRRRWARRPAPTA